ncbi:mobilisation protein (MobC) [Alkalibacterium gilvum]|uniref:Mobilisation protein (MobC) n=1 Tax=Alkalibacterium gilvum TaxID=1130080 RepID=A0A1H6UZC0_9LACT|nr:plasmid mobilization relaxosome protein MobC [Alkalibacterium gilvum]SEI97591.1 mobilisation protein (MobC) [Alkalibacterium gilvum]
MATILKDTKRNRENRVCFDLSHEEMTQLNNRLKYYHLNNRSDFIREAVLNNYIIVNDDTNLRELIYEVNKIGNNINQLTRLANKTKIVYSDDIENLKKQMNDINLLIYKTLMKHNEKR